MMRHNGLTALLALSVAQSSFAQDTSKAEPAQGDNPLRALQGLFDRFRRPVEPPTSAAPERGPGAAAPLVPLTPSKPIEPVLQPSPQLGEATKPTVTPTAASAAAPSVAKAVAPQAIVLLLPTKSTLLARAAEIARQGFTAAQQVSGETLSVTLLETDGTAEDAVNLYKAALANGATVVVGPLTRVEVTAIAKSGAIAIPTLALNAPDADVKLPHNLIAFGLPIEQEARELARFAAVEGAKRAVVVTLASPLQKRAAAAFTESWVKQGGQIVSEIEVATQGSYSKLRGQLAKLEADVIFLSADAERARLIRPQLGKRTILATSQVFAGIKTPKKRGVELEPDTAFHDLNGIRFVDMPWLHQPDHAATVIYPRPEKALAGELERLYALGIDAYRLAVMLARRNEARAAAVAANTAAPSNELNLDGVTGKLTVRDGNVERAPIQAAFRDGQVVAVTE